MTTDIKKNTTLQPGEMYHNSNGKDYKIISTFFWSEYGNGSWACCVLRSEDTGEYILAKYINKIKGVYAKSWGFGDYYGSDMESFKACADAFREFVNSKYFTSKV